MILDADEVVRGSVLPFAAVIVIAPLGVQIVRHRATREGAEQALNDLREYYGHTAEACVVEKF